MVLGAVLALVRARKIVRATIVSLSHFAKEWFEPLHGDGERGRKVICVCLVYRAGLLVLSAFTFVARVAGKKGGPQST